MIRSISVYTDDEPTEGVKNERCKPQDPDPAAERHSRHHPSSIVWAVGRFPRRLLLAPELFGSPEYFFLSAHGIILQDWWARLESHQLLLHVTQAVFCYPTRPSEAFADLGLAPTLACWTL